MAFIPNEDYDAWQEDKRRLAASRVKPPTYQMPEAWQPRYVSTYTPAPDISAPGPLAAPSMPSPWDQPREPDPLLGETGPAVIGTLPSAEERGNLLRESAAAGWQFTPRAAPPQPVPWWQQAAEDVGQAIGTGNEWARQNVPTVGGIEDIAGQTLGGIGAISQRVSQPSAEVLYGGMVRGEVPAGKSSRGLPELPESVLLGLGRLGREAVTPGPNGEAPSLPAALQQARQRWWATPAPEALKAAAEIATPSELALSLAPIPIEKAAAPLAAGARALGRAATSPQARAAAERVSRVLPRIGLGIEDVTAKFEPQIAAETQRLLAQAGPGVHAVGGEAEDLPALYEALANPATRVDRQNEIINQIAGIRAVQANPSSVTYPIVGSKSWMGQPTPPDLRPRMNLEAYEAAQRAEPSPAVARALQGHDVLKEGGASYGADPLVGKAAQATGADPNKAYEFRYRVVDLGDLVPSHTDRLGVNPAFPAELQPRERSRAASELQIDKMSRQLQPAALLNDIGTLDRGPMIVGPDNVVESGNGRILALRRAQQAYPEQFARYQQELRAKLPDYGIDPKAVEGMQNPVLVRERLTPVDRPAFAAEANQSAVLAMSPYEQAMQDAGRLSDEMVVNLDVAENQSINAALTSANNRGLVRSFIGAVPENERAALVGPHGELNALGLERLRTALFARTFTGEAGRRLTQAFSESLDSTVKQIENGLFASLPQLARAESLIRAGFRDAGLSIGEDLSKAVDILARLRQNGMRVDDYLQQTAMFDRELTPLQERLLAYLTAIGRSPKRVREFVGAYADAVENAPAAGQTALFSDLGALSKEEILDGILRREADREAARSPLFQPGREQAGEAEAAQGATAAEASPELEGRVLNPPEQVGPPAPPPAPAPPTVQPTVNEPGRVLPPAARAPEVLPLVKPGFVRLYRGIARPSDLADSLAKITDDLKGGRSFTADPDYAENMIAPYGGRGEQGMLLYVDVPEDVARVSLGTNWGDPQYVLPAKWAKHAKEITPELPRPRLASQPERVIPQPEQPRRPLPDMREPNAPPRDQLDLGLEGTQPPETFTPPDAQGRLPGEPGRVPPTPPTVPTAPEPHVAPEPPGAGEILPRFPANDVLEARTMTGGWRRKGVSLLAQAPVPGAKGVVKALDPWAAAQSHLERVPLVFRQMEAMGGDITRTAMAHLEAIPLKGVKIREGYFVDGVTPKVPGLSMATSDVLEHPGRYELVPALQKFVTAANALNDDLVRWAKQEGVKIPMMHFEEGGHYFGRLVREVRDVEKRGRISPDMPRHYDSMEAGMDAGVRYEDDLLATAQAGYSWLIRKIIGKRMGQYAAELGRTPKQLIPPEITARAVEAVGNLRVVNGYEKTIQNMRDGMSPFLQVRMPNGSTAERLRSPLAAADRLRPGLSASVVAAWRKVASLPLDSAARQQAFREMADDLKTWKTGVLGEYHTATAERAKALRGLQSPEYADAERFGLPKGTIGVGAVHQAWAAGRAFPRATADYLNQTFGETSHKILRAMDTVSSTSRTLVAGFDLGTTAIQLQGVMFWHPRVWGKAFGNMFAAVADPQTYHAYMARPSTQAVLKKLVPHGLNIEGVEYAEAATRGGALEKLAGKLGPRVGGAIGRQVLTRAQMAFTGPLNVGKVELAKALLPAAERVNQLDDLAMFLNNITGTRSSLAAGIGPGQRSIESSLLFFSPRFTRSSLAIVGDALQGTIKGSEARRALASLMVGSTFITGGLRLALGQPVDGRFFDPSSPEFQTVELFGRHVGLGGPYRALAVLLGTSYKTARSDPGLFLDVKNRQENPLTRWWTGRAAPVTGLLWDAAEGRDFLGEPLDNPGAWALRGAKMVTPMAAAEFLPSPGEKPQEPLSLIPDILGLRAVPLSPAQERDRLRDQFAQREHGGTWEALSRPQQAQLEQRYPELAAAKTGAIETYARRGSVLHQYLQAVATLRQKPEAQIQALTDRLRAGTLSGRDYRQQVQDLEAEMARVPAQLQQLPEYASIPAKQKEQQTWAEIHNVPTSERQAPADQFLDDYYGLTDSLRDPKTGQLDPAQLVRAREDLKAQYPPAVVAEATAYLNRNRAPELVKAQSEYAQYMALPKYLGFSRDQQDEADRIGRFVTAYSAQLGDPTKARALALKTFGASKYGLFLASQQKNMQNPERKIYRLNHPDIDRFYGNSDTAEFNQLVPAGSR